MNLDVKIPGTFERASMKSRWSHQHRGRSIIDLMFSANRTHLLSGAVAVLALAATSCGGSNVPADAPDVLESGMPENNESAEGFPIESTDNEIIGDQFTADFEIIDGPEIEALLSGRRISTFGHENTGSRRFGEAFYQDGRWHASYQSRMLLQFTGLWTIADDQICVETEDWPLECREIWHDQASGDIMIADLRATPESHDSKVRMSIFDLSEER
ncbi:hypothetical protein [Parasphingopyxis sp.]|uniref:hypothetical protein n=1 Tax=Parasphingopyxis sp. TaxID=1920299 RepID=UPI0026110DEC|nr:hypothetical protein [Parasphingopyxis sp.]